jgi:hypothetical protein
VLLEYSERKQFVGKRSILFCAIGATYRRISGCPRQIIPRRIHDGSLGWLPSLVWCDVGAGTQKVFLVERRDETIPDGANLQNNTTGGVNGRYDTSDNSTPQSFQCLFMVGD